MVPRVDEQRRSWQRLRCARRHRTAGRGAGCRDGAARRGPARTPPPHLTPWLSALVDLAVAARPEGLAQAELLHLAGRRTRDGVNEVDRRRRLVTGDALLAVPDHGRLVDLAAGSPHDDRLDGLAPLLVRHTDHRALGHAFERVDAVLDLDR